MPDPPFGQPIDYTGYTMHTIKPAPEGDFTVTVVGTPAPVDTDLTDLTDLTDYDEEVDELEVLDWKVVVDCPRCHVSNVFGKGWNKDHCPCGQRIDLHVSATSLSQKAPLIQEMVDAAEMEDPVIRMPIDHASRFDTQPGSIIMAWGKWYELMDVGEDYMDVKPVAPISPGVGEITRIDTPDEIEWMRVRRQAASMRPPTPKSVKSITTDDVDEGVFPVNTPLEQQVGSLAEMLMEDFGGPDRSEGAVEMAMRLLRQGQEDTRERVELAEECNRLREHNAMLLDLLAEMRERVQAAEGR